MAGPNPRGFDPDVVAAGLKTAMKFGAPSDGVTFFMPTTSTATGLLDDEGMPWDPAVQPVTAAARKRTVDCAFEYLDREGKVENLGLLVPSQVRITLLSAEYESVKGFEYVVIAGQRYLYQKTEPPVALGSLEVWTVYARAEDLG